MSRRVGKGSVKKLTLRGSPRLKPPSSARAVRRKKEREEKKRREKK